MSIVTSIQTDIKKIGTDILTVGEAHTGSGATIPAGTLVVYTKVN